MRFVYFILVQIACASAYCAQDAVQMPAMRISASDFYFDIEFDTETDELIRLRVTDVKPGSTAEKFGLRKGDCLAAINGVPVAGRKRGSLVDENRAVEIFGTVTFTGRRGLFRKEWKITVDVNSLAKKTMPNKAPEPTTGTVTPRAPSSTSRASPGRGSS
jgi:hypothetical protein